MYTICLAEFIIDKYDNIVNSQHKRTKREKCKNQLPNMKLQYNFGKMKLERYSLYEKKFVDMKI